MTDSLESGSEDLDDGGVNAISPRWWHIDRYGWIVGLAAITMLGAITRLAFLTTIPVGFFFDVAAYLFDALDVAAGAKPLWFPRNNGREPLMIYAMAASMAFVGTGVIAAKITTALTGILAIPATYILGREAASMLPIRRARAVGLFSAFIAATMYWHIHFSRLGLRTIGLSLFLPLGIGLILSAIRKRSPHLAILAGAATGAALYTYTASRLIPLALLPFLILMLAINWRDLARVRVLALVTLTFIIVAAPLSIYYWENAQLLDQRTAAVSVLNSEVSGGDPLRAGLSGLARTALSVVWQGSPSGLENLPDRPLFEPVSALAFVFGLSILVLVALRGSSWATRVQSGFLLLLLSAMALVPALSVNPPGFVRVSGLVPIVVVIAALGIERIWHLGQAQLGRFAPAGLVVLLMIPATWSLVDYFVIWAPSEIAYHAVMEDKVEAANDVATWLQEGDRVFLAPLYARDFTFTYMLRDRPPESFDIGASIVIPADQRTKYALPVEDASGIATIASRLGRDARFEVLSDRTGQYPLISVITLEPSADPREQKSLATFDDGIVLERFELGNSVVPVGGTVRFALWFRANATPSVDYSVFIHGRDQNNGNRFQRDRMPGDGSVPTSRWRIGDQIGDFHELVVPADLPPGPYKFVIGLYQLSTGERLTIVDRPDRPNEIAVATITIQP